MSTTLHNLDHLNARHVADLVQSAAWPCVTLLMDTTPAERMSHADRARLDQLVADAEHQLSARGAIGAGNITAQLRALVNDAARRPTGRGLAILVSRTVQRSYRLPEPVSPVVVVEETFRTRELLHTLHRTPPHLLLVLHPTCAQLYRVYADTLTPHTEDGFPVQLAAPARGQLQGGEDLRDTHLTTVERCLARARRRHPAPIIVAGDSDQVGTLLRRSRHLHRLAGVLTGPEVAAPGELYLAAKASLEEYLLARQEEALLLLESARRERPDDVHCGIDAAWSQMAGNATPVMLLVEEGFQFPAVVSGDGVHRLDWFRGPEAVPAGAHTDLVDDLIELVIDRGGWVAFASDGTLRAEERVALVVRSE
ncbi:hypothetical protein [Nocardioides taihuensis]|uniref:Uncharacterized protein n=1 Tax=Nocardioides taihuensis TaxID=1835606 RepID=A0ABW0BH62_9ACTN